MKEKKEKPAKFFVSLKLILKKRNKILILTESGTGFFDIPGGLIDEKEEKLPIQKVIKREANEELGSNVKYKILNPVINYRRFDKSKRQRAFTIAYEAKYLSGEIKLSFEHEKYEWVDPKKFNSKNWKFYSKEERLVFEEYFNKLKGRKNNELPCGASSFSGFHLRPAKAGQGIPAAKIKLSNMAKTKIIKSRIYRSADTGRFVGKKYAKKHPKTTVREVVKKRG